MPRWTKAKSWNDIKKAKGYMIVMDAKNSSIAKYLGIRENGKYVLRVGG